MKRVTLPTIIMALVALAGSPSLEAGTDYPVGDGPISVVSADLDGDNDNDLAVGNSISDNVSILINNGDGSFAAAVNYAVGSSPTSVFAADLDGDGDNDLAVACYFTQSVGILLNNGDGTFASAVYYYTSGSGFPISVFSADLDGDNDNDLAVANAGYHTVSILKNNGDGTFAEAGNYSLEGQNSVFSADLDGDNDSDLAVGKTSYIYPFVGILKNDGDGTFAEPVYYGTEDYYWYDGISVFSADLDGDSHNDLAVAAQWVGPGPPFPHKVCIFLNNGDGTFVEVDDYCEGSSSTSVFSADLDGDGDNDLAVANRSDNVSILLNQTGPYPSCCNGDGIRGDADNSGGSPNVGDLSHLVSYLFDQPPGPAPPCFEEGDVDASSSINVGDLSHLVSYLFDQPHGPAPLPCP